MPETSEYQEQTPGAFWHAQIKAAEKYFDNWKTKGKRVVKRYRDERDAIDSQRRKFNILWSNIQVLFPALYGRMPKPQVSRRYLDNDPPSRIASMMLERCIEYEVEQFCDFNASMCCVVEDRLLPGRGQAWIRFEPTMEDMDEAPPEGEISDDQEASPSEEPAQRITAAHSPIDYVHWPDFLHSPARTWEEVWWVGRWVYMTKDEGLERFGDVFKLVPCESMDQEDIKGKDKAYLASMDKKAKVAEIWNKRTGKVCWVAKGYPEALDERDDLLHLADFFPCPKPLYATTTTGSLIPVPDYCEYEDQAYELDNLTQRITLLVKAAKAVGVFNGEYKELARLLNEGVDNKLFPVNDWNSLAEKGGLNGAVQMLDVSPTLKVLAQLYESRDVTKNVIYEVMGMSDIMRGASEPSETLGAQQLKAQFGSLRLKSSQGDVARFASELFKMKAELIARFYPDELIVQMSGIESTDDGKDPGMIQAGLQIIRDAEIRDFRIEVESDSLGQVDEQAEQQGAMQLVGAIGSYFQQALPLAQAEPKMIPLIGEVLMFAMRRFRTGRTIENAFEKAMTALSQQAMQPPPPNPELQANQVKANAEIGKAQAGVQTAVVQSQAAKVKAVSEIAQAHANIHSSRAQTLQATADIAQVLQPQPPQTLQ